MWPPPHGSAHSNLSSPIGCKGAKVIPWLLFSFQRLAELGTNGSLHAGVSVLHNALMKRKYRSGHGHAHPRVLLSRLEEMIRRREKSLRRLLDVTAREIAAINKRLSKLEEEQCVDD